MGCAPGQRGGWAGRRGGWAADGRRRARGGIMPRSSDPRSPQRGRQLRECQHRGLEWHFFYWGRFCFWRVLPLTSPLRRRFGSNLCFGVGLAVLCGRTVAGRLLLPRPFCGAPGVVQRVQTGVSPPRSRMTCTTGYVAPQSGQGSHRSRRKSERCLLLRAILRRFTRFLRRLAVRPVPLVAEKAA